MEYPGKFIVFEGIDGSGKTTQIELLAETLRDKGHDVVVVREPGSTSISEQIRNIILDPNNKDMDPMCELLLFEASRAQLVNEAIIPCLKRGAIVLCDRYIDSTVAYQVGCREQSISFVEKLNKIVTHSLKPDMTFWFYISPEEAIKRMGNECDRMEATAELHKVDWEYHKLFAFNDDITIIDGTLEQDLLARKIYGSVRRFLYNGCRFRSIR